MKCLEFLYFYLMDETSPRPDLSIANVGQLHLPPLSLPPSPTKQRYFPQSSRNASSCSDDSITSSGSSTSSSSSSSTTTTSSSSTSLSSLSTPAHTRFLNAMPKTPPSPTKPSTQSCAKPSRDTFHFFDVTCIPVTSNKNNLNQLRFVHDRPESCAPHTLN